MVNVVAGAEIKGGGVIDATPFVVGRIDFASESPQ
jgi:hypothetical protein